MKSAAKRRVEKRDRERADALILLLVNAKLEASRLGLFETLRAIDEATKRIGWELGDKLDRDRQPARVARLNKALSPRRNG